MVANKIMRFSTFDEAVHNRTRLSLDGIHAKTVRIGEHWCVVPVEEKAKPKAARPQRFNAKRV